MGNTHSIIPAWLTRLLASKPSIQPRCSCGRYCSTHEPAPDMTAKLVAELTAQNKHVPSLFRRASMQEGE